MLEDNIRDCKIATASANGFENEVKEVFTETDTSSYFRSAASVSSTCFDVSPVVDRVIRPLDFEPPPTKLVQSVPEIRPVEKIKDLTPEVEIPVPTGDEMIPYFTGDVSSAVHGWLDGCCAPTANVEDESQRLIVWALIGGVGNIPPSVVNRRKNTKWEDEMSREDPGTVKDKDSRRRHSRYSAERSEDHHP